MIKFTFFNGLSVFNSDAKQFDCYCHFYTHFELDLELHQ